MRTHEAPRWLPRVAYAAAGQQCSGHCRWRAGGGPRAYPVGSPQNKGGTPEGRGGKTTPAALADAQPRRALCLYVGADVVSNSGRSERAQHPWAPQACSAFRMGPGAGRGPTQKRSVSLALASPLGLGSRGPLLGLFKSSAAAFEIEMGDQRLDRFGCCSNASAGVSFRRQGPAGPQWPPDGEIVLAFDIVVCRKAEAHPDRRRGRLRYLALPM
jgi:hypothetical protein